jgi:2-keto-4-pentenoate hydratase/2-oxohepta-3-ene-1,7-dioic acid hydratase in catechol pathway
MRLATVKHGGEALVVAAVDDALLLPLSGRAGMASGPADLQSVIESWDRGVDRALSAYIQEHRSNTDLLLSTDEIEWLPPLPRPGKICGVAMNNSASNERKISAPEHPAFFLKPTSCLLAHEAEIEIRSYYGSVHPEPELAVVLGKTLRDVTPEEAAQGIFGYTIFDDITGNGMRAQDMFRYYALYPKPENPDEVERVEQHLSYAARYKGTDCFGVMGPWVVTADEIENPDDLAVSCYIGDEKIADDSTRFYNYKVAEVLSFLSYFQTLSAGDVVSMGTAFKPGATRRSIHHANFLRVGGPVTVEIECLGSQSNPVVIKECELGRWRYK